MRFHFPFLVKLSDTNAKIARLSGELIEKLFEAAEYDYLDWHNSMVLQNLNNVLFWRGFLDYWIRIAELCNVYDFDYNICMLHWLFIEFSISLYRMKSDAVRHNELSRRRKGNHLVSRFRDTFLRWANCFISNYWKPFAESHIYFTTDSWSNQMRMKCQLPWYAYITQLAIRSNGIFSFIFWFFTILTFIRYLRRVITEWEYWRCSCFPFTVCIRLNRTCFCKRSSSYCALAHA